MYRAPLFHGRHLDQLAPPPHVVDELELCLAGRRCGGGLHRLSEPQDDPGVNRIGLGQTSASAGKVSDLARVDTAERDLPVRRIALEAGRVTTRRLA